MQRPGADSGGRPLTADLPGLGDDHEQAPANPGQGDYVAAIIGLTQPCAQLPKVFSGRAGG